MNVSRAKEHFSAYREGTLDAALRVAFEHALQSDAGLQAEYKAFELTLDDLDSLHDEVIEPPMWLSDRIATRLDEAQANRAKAPIWWTGWFRNLAFGGLAVAAIGGAVVGMWSRSGPAVGSIGGPVPMSVPTPLIHYHQDGDLLEISSSGDAIATSGDVSYRFGGNLKGELRNPNRNPAVFSIQVNGKELDVIAMPGTDHRPLLTGEGSLVDFAKTLAAASGRSVHLPADSKATRVSWDLAGKDVLTAANASLESNGFSAEQRDGGEIALVAG